jgi:hypothetical protein
MHALTVNRRSGRTLFLTFLCAVYVALIAAAPALHTSAPVARASAPRDAPPTFQELDRNGDGFLDTREAAAFPALKPLLERAGVPAHGKIDQVRFARALALLDNDP